MSLKGGKECAKVCGNDDLAGVIHNPLADKMPLEGGGDRSKVCEDNEHLAKDVPVEGAVEASKFSEEDELADPNQTPLAVKTLLKEWELVDDDGFLYKRRKMAAITCPPGVVEGSDKTAPTDAQSSDREASSRMETMALLLAQKTKYSAEISQWERLLNMEEQYLGCSSNPESTAHPESLMSPSLSDKVDDFKKHLQLSQLQVEEFEGLINQLQALRDQGESICRQLEEQAVTDQNCIGQDLLNEIGRVTPRCIIHSLTAEPALAFSVRRLPLRRYPGMVDG